jgi:hypothetical protein
VHWTCTGLSRVLAPVDFSIYRLLFFDSQYLVPGGPYVFGLEISITEYCLRLQKKLQNVDFYLDGVLLWQSQVIKSSKIKFETKL